MDIGDKIFSNGFLLKGCNFKNITVTFIKKLEKVLKYFNLLEIGSKNLSYIFMNTTEYFDTLFI